MHSGSLFGSSLRGAAAAVLAVWLAGAAQAASITSPAVIGGAVKVITFDSWNGITTAGPFNVGAEVGDEVLFSSVPNSTIGASSFNLGDNGSWGGRGDPVNGLIDTPTGSGNFLASAFVTRRGELGFSFAKPVSAVGAFMNQFQTPGATNNRLVLIAYDIDGNELESYSQMVDTAAQSRNAGSFFGIQRASADIYGFGVADGSFVMDNLTYAAPVPEPTSYALVLAGLCVIGWSVNRRKNKAADHA